MTDTLRRLGSLLASAALVAGLGACSGQATDGASGEASKATEEQGAEEEWGDYVAPKQEAPDAGGRIDVTKTGEQLSTFEGAKYIVSDATIDQTQGESYGLQEICVVRQPEDWSGVESIGWDRNSITYNRIPAEWGTKSYRFEYINEAGSDNMDATWSRTTEEGFFGQDAEIQHEQVDGHDVAYVVNNDAVYEIAPGINDLEAHAEGVEPQNAFISVHAWESRGDACAFAVSISCEVSSGDASSPDPMQLINEAYGCLEFLDEAPSNLEAASYTADIVIANADGSHKVTVKRDGATLLGFTSHSVTLADYGEGASYATLLFDYAPEGGLEGMEEATTSTDTFSPDHGFTDVQVSDVEQYEVDGLTVNARVVTATFSMGDSQQGTTRELRAWTDVEGSALYVQTTLQEDEDVAAAVEHVLDGRIAK